MKLLELLRNFSNLEISYPLIILTLFLTSCDDKLPTKSVDNSILTYSQSTLTGSDFDVTKVRSKYAAGKDGNLFFGENDEIKAISLVRFTSFEYVPDTLDEVLDLNLTLYVDDNLPIDTNNVDNNYVNIYLVKTQLDWEEEDATFNMENPLYLDNIEKELIARYLIGDQDTCIIDLMEYKDKFIPFWLDSIDAASGIILEGDDENGENIQRIYSMNSSGREPRFSIDYRVEEDTLSKIYIPNDDITICFDKKDEDRSGFLSISEAYNEAVTVNFSINDLMSVTDSNVYVPEAKLKLYIDRENSEFLQDDIYLYMALLDTADYYDEYLYDITASDNGLLVEPDDSVAVFTLSSDIQTYFAGYQENFGMIIWSAFKSNDMSQIRFFDNNAEEGLKPELKVLFAKEARK